MKKAITIICLIVFFLSRATVPLFAQDSKSAAKETSKPAAKADLNDYFQPELLGYLYYYHDGSAGNGKTNSFDISRAYIGARYKLSDNFSFRYLSDIGHSLTGEFEMFTKYAYLDWKLDPKANLLIGLQSTSNFKVEEKAWGYRVIRKAPMESFGDYFPTAIKNYTDRLDARKAASTAAGNTSAANEIANQKKNFATSSKGSMSSSADQGIGLSLKPGKNAYIDLIVRNGSGYKKAEDDKQKDFSARVGGYFLEKKLHLSAFMEVEPWSGTNVDGSYKSFTNFQYDLFGSYSYKEDFILGVNFNSKKFAGPYEDITATNFAVFTSFSLAPKKVKALARFDSYRTGFNKNSATPNLAELKTNANLFIVGLDFLPDKRVHIIPNLQILKYEDSSIKSNKAFYIHMQVEL